MVTPVYFILSVFYSVYSYGKMLKESGRPGQPECAASNGCLPNTLHTGILNVSPMSGWKQYAVFL